MSPIYNNMWCLRVYPNGKTIKGDFLIQLQLCGLPGQTSKIKVNWKISCHAVSVSAGIYIYFPLIFCVKIYQNYNDII